jgi:4-amino-4-deoxy-L-arabinose transferase-like glycosyltransferase
LPEEEVTSAQPNPAARREHSWLIPGLIPGPIQALALGLALLFSLSGLTGHDPWKQDEAYSFGMVLNMVETGDWVVPRLADDPFMEKPPLYYWTAAGLVHLLAGKLPAHDAARLATGIYLLLTLLCVALLARLVWGAGAAALAVLVSLSTLVVVQHGHYLITDSALSAGLALGLLGLAMSHRRWLLGGIALGTGAGLAFLAKGLLGPGMLGVSALVLPLFPAWRSERYAKSLAVAALAALPWVLIWPTALYLRDPALFQLWFWDNNFGRYLGGVDLGPPAQPDFWLRTWPWVTFPAAPLALWALWVQRRALLANPSLQAALVLSLVGWTVLFLAHTARDLYALPLIAPLAVIAAGGLTQLPPRVCSASFWLSAGLFTLLALALWFVWLSGSLTGSAPDWPIIARHLPLEHAFARPWPVLAAAVVVSLGWGWLLWRIRPPGPGALLAWPAGMVLLWCLLAWLHFPWIDQAKSYRAVMRDIQAALPREFNCVADLVTPESLRLRESERGLLHYFAGVKIQHASSPAHSACDFILLEVQQRKHPDGVSLGPDWELIWSGQRQADTRDAFLLFQRRPQASATRPARGETL